jgi:hypothetical protein
MDKMAKMTTAYVVRLNGKGPGSIEYINVCEAPHCENLPTSDKTANYGLCDEHYKSTNYDCTRCDTPAFHWCVHKS